MKFKKRTLAATLAASTVLGGAAAPAWADAGGVAAGLMGGMLLGGAIRGNREAERRDAYNAGYDSRPQTVVVAAPPARSGRGDAEQRISELNDMHAKGLISDSEYASKKQSILNSM